MTSSDQKSTPITADRIMGFLATAILAPGLAIAVSWGVMANSLETVKEEGKSQEKKIDKLEKVQHENKEEVIRKFGEIDGKLFTIQYIMEQQRKTLERIEEKLDN